MKIEKEMDISNLTITEVDEQSIPGTPEVNPLCRFVSTPSIWNFLTTTENFTQNKDNFVAIRTIFINYRKLDFLGALCHLFFLLSNKDHHQFLPSSVPASSQA